ncbi:ABC-2 type transporter-domain-containing protein [Cyathus striatus]|nr:ABC-2 type transporter-domain-containing protein [Cyathus striatus]
MDSLNSKNGGSERIESRTIRDESAPVELHETISSAHRCSVASEETAVEHEKVHLGGEQDLGGEEQLQRQQSLKHIPLAYFDPPGVNGLSRRISRGPSTSVASRPSTVVEEQEQQMDLEKALKEWLRKQDEAQIKTRELGVMFEDLRVVGLGATQSLQVTVGSLLNPMTYIRMLHSILRPTTRDIISGFNGAVKPGEMLLVLGRPGAGCSTFLRTLANHRADFHAIHGNVYYDSLTPRQVSRQFRGDVQYCPEDDIHFPTLTVEQTIRFAVQTRAPQARIEGQSRKEYVRIVTDAYLTIFGLKHARNTPVGDATIRGVSGGEKKRVSICETLATRSLITCWDNSTRGLDASTALEFVRALRIATDLARVSTIVSIYQAGESIYEVFDKVCLIYEGRMVYFGAANEARQYFIDMGYVPANRQTTADFLVLVTDPSGRNVRERIGQVPRTPEEFERYYLESEVFRKNKEDMEQYKDTRVANTEAVTAYKESSKAEHARHTLHTLRIVMVRRMQIMKGDWTSQAFHAAMFIFQAIIVSTTFIKLPDSTSAYFSRGGVLFFSVLVPSLFNMSEIPSLFTQRSHVPPMIDALAMTLVDLPITFLYIVPFTVIIYFVVKLQQTAGQFFIFFVFIFVVAISMKAFFRALAAAFPSVAPAQAFAGVLLLALLLYTGYQIPKPSMIGALKWITYINPIRYTFEGVMTNEFSTLHGVCSDMVPSGPGYENVPLANKVCTVVGSDPGELRVNGNSYLAISFSYYRKYLWRNFGILIAFGAFFLFCLLIFTQFNKSGGSTGSVLRYHRGLKSTLQSRHTGGMHVFSWVDITYSVPYQRGSRQLLNHVSGYVIPGKLTVLMGESGAGKTTLLNTLADRTNVGVITGERLFNGQPLPLDFQAQTGYCQQMDTHIETTTVREALRFSARLRQPSSSSVKEKDAYADKCLKMCGMEPFADAIVGSLGVEHKKRTTIGVELAAKPRLLLFLDEPTSGLDSQSAWAIVQFLRTLADSGQAILCTYPSAELFQVFDRLLLLKTGGQTVYFGELGHHANTMINYLRKTGLGNAIPRKTRRAEFMLDVIGAGATAVVEQDWHGIWLHSQNRKDLSDELDSIHAEGRSHPPAEVAIKSEFAMPWIYQTTLLMQRQFQGFWRDPTYIMSKMILNIFSGLFIGFTFFKAKNNLQGIQNKLFTIFMATFMSAPLGNQMQVPYMKTRNVYLVREHSSRTYSWSAYATSQLLCELPWNIFGSSIYFLCWYWAVDFPQSRTGFTYFIYGVLYPFYYTSLALAVASVSPTAELAGLVMAVLFTFVVTFNGVMQPFQLLGWWKWMYRLSPYTYLIEALVGQAVGHQQIRCDDRELVTIDPPSSDSCQSYMAKYMATRGGYLTNPSATSSCHYCSSSNTDQWLGSHFNIYYSHHWRDFGLFWAYIVFNSICVWVQHLNLYLNP